MPFKDIKESGSLLLSDLSVGFINKALRSLCQRSRLMKGEMKPQEADEIVTWALIPSCTEFSPVPG